MLQNATQHVCLNGLALTLLCGGAVRGEATERQPVRPEVTAYVCASLAIPPLALPKAKQVAGKIFADIGLSIRWRVGAPRTYELGNGGVALGIRLILEVPHGLDSNGLAVTAPEHGQPMISISYRRVASAYGARGAPVVLGYVLAHEIAHVLQGVGSRHSETGILKAQWDRKDYLETEAGRLTFASEDIMLIRRWVKAAAASAAVFNYGGESRPFENRTLGGNRMADAGGGLANKRAGTADRGRR